MNHEHPNITEVVPDTSEAGSKKFKVTLFESFGKNFLEQNEKQKLYNKEVGIKQESERKKQSAVHIKENKIPVYYNTANYTGAVNKLVNANEVPKLNEKTMENMCMASQLEKKTRQKKVVLSCEIVGSNVSSSKVELLHTPPVQAYPEMFATQSLDKAASHKFIKNRMKCSVESSPSSYRQAYTFPADNGSAAVIPAVNSPEKTNVKILNTPKEWECHQCTLLNPETHSACMVCATTRSNETIKKKSTSQAQTYLHLVNLDNTDLVTNSEAFECLVCLMDVAIGEGVTLRECLHQFCRDCLARTIEFAEDAEVKCPFWDLQYSCSIGLQDREIKALVSPEIYEQHLAKSMSQAENQMEKTFHCKTPDCKGWCTFEDNVNEFRCPVCKKVSCLTCQAIHMGANCKQYQERMKEESMLNDESKRTKELLDEMVQKGEAIACPTCKVIEAMILRKESKGLAKNILE